MSGWESGMKFSNQHTLSKDVFVSLFPSQYDFGLNTSMTFWLKDEVAVVWKHLDVRLDWA